MSESTHSGDDNVGSLEASQPPRPSSSLSNTSRSPPQAEMSVPELGWRGFQFFDKNYIRDPNESKKKYYGFKNLSIKKWRASITKPFAIIACEGGVVFKVKSTLEVDFWKAYNRELIDLDLADNSKRSLVVTIGDDDVTNSSVVKLWDLDQWDKQSPTCRISVKASQGRKGATQTAVAVAIGPKQNLIAVGFADGAVSFCYGDLTLDKTYRWKNLRDGSNSRNDGALIGLSVANYGDGKSVIYVICESSVHSYVLNGETVIKNVTHDARGALPNCWRFNAVTNQLIVANNDMVYFYDVSQAMDGSARCHGLGRGSNKVQVLCASYYLVLVTDIQKPIPGTSSMLNIYDVECRYVASTFPMGKTQLFALGADIYTINEDGSLAKYSEKPMSTRLDIVMKKNLFDVAIALAKRDRSTELSAIHLKYAEYLYQRGDFSNSAQQYVETIGHLEPSTVIAKFLEGNRSTYLGLYLEALHKRKLANENHTLLLLGAYLKSGDEVKVRKFVDNAKNVPSLDVNEAVKLLRHAGKYQFAAELATNFNRNLLTFSILVEDLKDFDGAIHRLETVSGKQLFEVLDAYGLALLEYKESDVIEHVAKAVQSDDVDMAVLIKLLNNYPQYLQTMYNIAHEKVKSNLTFRNTILENSLERFKMDENTELDSFRDFILGLVDEDNIQEALRLGRLHNFSPLVIHILQHTNNQRGLAEYLIHEGGVDEILDICDEKMIRSMWIELINFVAKSKNIDENYVISILKKITATKYVHPLMVTKILAQNSDLTIGCVQEYLMNWLAEQTEQIKETTRMIEEKVKQAEECEKQIDAYDDDVQIFQSVRCSVCSSQLTIPAVHFTCKHAFHLHCYESYSDHQEECPLCADDAEGASGDGTTSTMMQQSHNAPITIEDLKTQFEANGNTMNVIAEFIARGAFDDNKSSKSARKSEPVRRPEPKLHSSTNPFENDTEEPEPEKREPVSTNPFETSTNPFEEDD